jgi:serine/threonine protein kinase
LCGIVPFPGTNPAKVYDDIKNRKITWPADTEEIMSKEAIHLIDNMIKIAPNQRLGHNPETLKLLKTHPFFGDIDFDEISKPGYNAIRPLVLARF